MKNKKFLFALFLFWSSVVFSQIATPYSPANNFISDNGSIQFKWNGSNNSTYQVQISNSVNFAVLIHDFITNSTDTSLTFINEGTYFWRVKEIGQANFSYVSKFEYFLPQFLPGFKGWFSSLNVNGVTNGQQIQNWSSLVNNKNATNSNSSLCPTFRSNGGLANKPYVEFTGTPRYLTSNITGADIASNQPINFYFLGNLRNQGQQYGFIFTMANFTAFTPQQQNRAAYNYNFSSQFCWASNGSTTYFLTHPGAGYNLFNATDNTVNGRLYRNTQLLSTGNSAVYSINPTVPLILGSNVLYQSNSVLATSQMDVHEMLFFNVEHDTLTRGKLTRYLHQRYIPRLNLGKDTSTNSLCNSISLSIPSYFSLVYWDNVLGNNTTIITSPGLHHVKATDIFGNIHTDSIFISFPQVIYPPNTNICAGDTLIWEPFANSTFSYNWSNGNSNTTALISNVDTLFFIASDSQNCFYQSDTLIFQIDNFSQLANLGNDTSICQGSSISFGAFESQIVNTLWSSGGTNSSIVIQNPGTYSVIANNQNGCYVYDTISIDISGVAAIPNFEISNFCTNEFSHFYDLSTTQPGDTIISRIWQLNNSIISGDSTFNFQVFQNGVNQVRLELETNQGCKSVLNQSFTYYNPPIANFSFSGICPNDFTNFIDSSVPGDGAIINYFWNIDNEISQENNPSYIFGTTGTYNVSLQAQDINGCRDTVTQAVYIQPAPVAAFSFTNTCEETGVNFVNNSNIADTFNITTNTWTYGDGTQVINPSFQKIYADADTFDVQLIVTANNGCQDTSLQSIIIYPRPTLGWQIGPACKNTWTTFENLSSVSVGNISQTDWLINLQYPIEGISSAYQFVTTGVQYLNLTSTTDNGCQRDTLIIVNVQPEINASYIVSPQTIVAGVPTSFTSTSTGATEYTWNLGNGNIIQTTAIEPVEIPGFDASLIGDSIQTSLIIENTIGCKDTATQFIKIFEPRIDLAITQLFVQDLNGFYKVGVELRNLGFVEITKTDLLLKMYGSLPTLETENESLSPGESRIYLFNASPSAYISTQDNETSYLCVEATSYNDYQLIETELSNNVACLNTEGDNFVLLPIFPNPTNDDISYSFILSEEATLNIYLTDETGRIVLEQSDVHPSGLHTQVLSMRNLSAGVYYFHISDGTSAKTVKILKN
jgi:hypothetical protein